MISKETFVKTMQRLETLECQIDDVDAALHALSPDAGGFYIPEATAITIDLLREMFDDEDDLLGYFVYALNFLHDYKLGYVLDENENPVDVGTWEKVYDFLTYSEEE